MERNLLINWPALVEEARRRRKAQNLTQQRLAAIADVSTPTVSRFEGGEKNIQLASALAIMEVLGMTRYDDIEYVSEEPRYDFDRDVLRFGKARVGDRDIVCEITRETLADVCGLSNADSRRQILAFENIRERCEKIIRQKVLQELYEPNGPVLVTLADLQGTQSQ